jgi:hypothetical protein
MDEDYKFRVEMHDALFGGMVSTLEEIWQKQEAGEPVVREYRWVGNYLWRWLAFQI